MLSYVPRRWRSVVNSLLYTGLVALAAALGHLTFRATTSPHNISSHDSQTEPARSPLIELSGFSARREKSSDSERLALSFRLRLTARTPIDSYVYLIARNRQVSPKFWVAWPARAASAISTGGHFKGSAPPSGEAVRLTSSWTRVNATVHHPSGRPPFDTVSLYVVGSDGEILLERPFGL